MTASTISGLGRPVDPAANSSSALRHPEPISGAFQLALGLYILLTGSVPTIVQAMAFGLSTSGGNEFAVAMLTETMRDMLLLAPVLMLSKHPLGILHPLLLAVVVWPLLSSMPSIINDLGGWGGVIAGLPVSTPHFIGLRSLAVGEVWLGIAKFNGVQILGLLGTYAGFFLFSGTQDLSRPAYAVRQPASIRAVMIALAAISLLVLLVFIRSRGGINEHLTSFGAGRFKELAGYGPVIVLIDVGTVALMIWIAAKPDDIKSPAFLIIMGLVMAAAFVSNGSRGTAISVPMKVGLVWALRYNKVPWKIAFILLPLMFASIGLLGAVRSSSWSGSNAAQTLSHASWSQSFALAQDEVDNRQAMSSNVPVVLRGFAVSGGPLLGESYAAVATTFIPRAVWKDKPRGVGSLYARLFLGASFEGTSIPVYPEVEMYWNFGIPGLIILAIIYGVLLRRMYDFYWRRYLSPFATVAYLIFVTLFRFSSDRLVNLEEQFMEILLCYAVVALLVPKVGQAAGQLRNSYAGRPAGAVTNHHA